MAKSAWGIELGTSSVKAVKLSGDGGGVSLDTFTIIGLDEYGLGQGVSREDALAGALSALRVAEGIKKGDQIFVSLTGQNTLGRIISLPPVPKDRVRETIQNEARSQIPIKLEEAVWDYQVIEESEGEDELKVNLYAAKREVVHQLLECCDAAGLQVTGVQVAPLGIYNYIKYEFDDSVAESCVAIDIGADNTDVVLIDGQKTYVRVVPVAGNEITKALRQRFKLNVEDAEKLKRNAGKSKDAAAVFEAMKPPLKDMVGEIYRAVGFYKNQNESVNIGKLVMMGNGSKLLNIKKFFEQQLQYEVHKVEAPQRLTLSRNVDPAEIADTIQSLTVAVGLALQGLGVSGVNTINLLPAEYVAGKQTERLRTPFYVGGALAFVGGLIALLVCIVAAGGADAPLQEAENTKATASKARTAFTTLQNLESAQPRSITLQNMTSGVVGELDVTDAEGVVSKRKFTVRAAALPGILMRAVDAAVVDSQPRARVPYFRVSVPTTAGVAQRSTLLPGAGGFAVPHSSFSVQTMPENWTLDRPYWLASRTYTYELTMASALSADAGMSRDEAFNDLDKLLPGNTGTIKEYVDKALLEYLRLDGQLKDLTAEQQKAIKLNLTTSLIQLPPQQPLEFREMFQGARDVRMRNGGAQDDISQAAHPFKYAPVRLSVVITLNAIKPDEPAADAQG